MLIRSGDVTPKQFICPSSDDVPDDTQEIERYYDFQSIRTVSYGYQVPYARAAVSTSTRSPTCWRRGRP